MGTTAGSIGRTWNEAEIPDRAGRVAVVTGGNAGIGRQIARVLARHGAQVVLACSDLGKAKQAAERIRAEAGAAPGPSRPGHSRPSRPGVAGVSACGGGADRSGLPAAGAAHQQRRATSRQSAAEDVLERPGMPHATRCRHPVTWYGHLGCKGGYPSLLARYYRPHGHSDELSHTQHRSLADPRASRIPAWRTLDVSAETSCHAAVSVPAPRDLGLHRTGTSGSRRRAAEPRASAEIIGDLAFGGCHCVHTAC